MRFYGQVSYSFYVLHPLSLIVLWNIPREINTLRQAGISSLALACGFAILSTAVITPLAWLSWRYIELSGIALGRWITATPMRFKAAPLPAA